MGLLHLTIFQDQQELDIYQDIADFLIFSEIIFFSNLDIDRY